MTQPASTPNTPRPAGPMGGPMGGPRGGPGGHGPMAMMRGEKPRDRRRFLRDGMLVDEDDLVPRAPHGEELLRESGGVVLDDGLGSVDDGLAAPEVLTEIDPPRPGVARLEPEEIAHRGAPEAVDALIVVPDNGEVGPVARDEVEYALLGGVGVLVFVDEDVVEPSAQLFDDLGVSLQEVQTVPLQKGEIDETAR